MAEARPTSEQKEKIKRHLVELLGSPLLCQDIQDLRETLGLRQIEDPERGKVWSSATDDRERQNRYVKLLARAWLSGIGEEALASRLLTECWEEEDVCEFAGRIAQWLFSRGVSAVAGHVKPWYASVRGEAQTRKMPPGPISITSQTQYFGGKGPLHPTRVWAAAELKKDLEAHPTTLMRPVVGSSPVRRRAARMFIEVEPWAIDDDVREAFRYCIEPFLAQGQVGARALQPLEESSLLPPVDEHSQRRKRQLRRARPPNAAQAAGEVSLPRHNGQGKKEENEG